MRPSARLVTILALVAALSLLMSVMAPLRASAAANATAMLTAGADALPGPGTVSLRVTNTEAPGTIVNPGRSINYVDVVLPANAGIRLDPSRPATATGWTQRVTDLPDLAGITFRGGALNAGASLTITLPVIALPTLGQDLRGNVHVAVSADGGLTTRTAHAATTGALLMMVRTVEMRPDAFAPLAPAGVTDGSGTAGQSFTWGMTVKNHATEPIEVAPVLEAVGSPDEIISNVPPVQVAAGQAQAFSFQVQLSPVDQDRELTFRGSVVSYGGAVTRSFQIQRPSKVTLNYQSFQPSVVAAGTAVEFTILAEKAVGPALSLGAGNLVFAATDARLQQASFGAGQTTIQLRFGPTPVQGARGTHSGTFLLRGADENDHPFEQMFVRDGLVTILAVD